MRKNVISLLLLAAGCGPASLGGLVDGERVGGARDAVWDEVEVDWGPFGEWSATTVLVTDIPNTCEVLDAMADAYEFDCEERCEEYLEVLETHHLGQERYFMLSIYADTSDGAEGSFSQDEEVGEGEFNASFASWDVSVIADPDACEEACEEGELLEDESEEDTDGGELELGGFDGDILSGRFIVEFEGDEGVEGSFHAESCDLGEVWLP
jgi:hypothetical protein